MNCRPVRCRILSTAPSPSRTAGPEVRLWDWQGPSAGACCGGRSKLALSGPALQSARADVPRSNICGTDHARASPGMGWCSAGYSEPRGPARYANLRSQMWWQAASGHGHISRARWDAAADRSAGGSASGGSRDSITSRWCRESGTPWRSRRSGGSVTLLVDHLEAGCEPQAYGARLDATPHGAEDGGIVNTAEHAAAGGRRVGP